MKNFNLFHDGNLVDILVEATALDGVKRVANTLADDIALVTGSRPRIKNDINQSSAQNIIIVATMGNSALLSSLEKSGNIDLSVLIDKNEVYQMDILKEPSHPTIKNALLIIGSDKRGTIYGMFHLSEMCGVSPMVFWGDVAPTPQKEIIISLDSRLLSKEPSVKYRGFFINDEWPAFGKWCSEKFGGVNAKAYEKVFELLLRLKGNYLWPAMWKSSFWEDGPGLENARLADEYGVIMGASHHEPLCRAGVEWQRQYKKYSDDSTWSFISNKEAITQFWEDGLLRSKDFENIITIGMRGEDDSKLLGEDATLQDNIDVVKNAIIAQNKLIKKHINKDSKKEVPRMLAIYKEVEDFYFGDSDCDGLRGWSEIDDVILLLSDDNYGNLRSIPSLTDAPHPGGYGLYYHFDYHGAPVSYEWQNCTNLAKVWEQLTMAYEHGIRELWIVNVGDVKGNEMQLNYYMDLAYDFDKWGTQETNSANLYMKEWIDTQFKNHLTSKQKDDLADIMFGFSKWNSAMMPEALHENVYQNNYHESRYVWEEANELFQKAKVLRAQMPAICLSAYDSMIYYPAIASLNILMMNIEAGMNHELAKRGSLAANHYIQSIKNRILDDKNIVDEFHSALNGKWNHMMESAHTGFKSWDDNNWAYPIIQEVMPIPYAKIIVSFRGNNAYNLGHHWQDRRPICNSEFTRPDINEIDLDIDSRGDVDFSYEIHCDKPWLSFSHKQGNVNVEESARATIRISCDRSQLSGEDYAELIIQFYFANGDKKTAIVAIKAGMPAVEKFHGAFLESEDYICIEAEHYNTKADVEGDGWKAIKDLGKKGAAIKSFPVNKNWLNDKDKPFVQYSFIARQDGEYTLTFYFSPRNPILKGNAIKCCYSLNDSPQKMLDIVSEKYYTEWYDSDWSYGVRNKSRIVKTTVNLKKGDNLLRFFATEPNVILEQIVLNPSSKPLSKTQLAPKESYQLP